MDLVEIEWDNEDALIDEELAKEAKMNFKRIVTSLAESEHRTIVATLSALELTVSRRTGAIATNDVDLYINPEWWTSKNDAELRHCAAFIAFTKILSLIDRGKAIEDVNNLRWSIAANLVTNRLVLDLGIGVLPSKGAFITSIDGSMSCEEVYATLLKMTDDQINRAVWPLLYVGQASELKDGFQVFED